MSEVKCKKCGCEIPKGKDLCDKCEKKDIKRILKNKKILFIIGIVLIAIISVTVVIVHNNKVKHDNLPIKVDIQMTSYFGSIGEILNALDLDFDLVTMGANCFTGVQRNQFNTKKYGILYTEFRYCKSNYTTVFRVYNNSKDQELRDPKPGELPQFDKYGSKITNNTGL